VSGFDFRRAIPFVEAIPPGRWTSYKDVATAAGNPMAFQTAGNKLRDSGGRIRHYWRVIHSDGSVPENFTAPADRGPKDPDSARRSS
jgi:alkylated DNA nucleotide flippase Atl1